jgi:hypothetical protein
MAVKEIKLRLVVGIGIQRAKDPIAAKPADNPVRWRVFLRQQVDTSGHNVDPFE